MVTEAPTLYPTPSEITPPPGRGKHGYYRNKKGWIVVQSTTPANRSGTEYKGGVLLLKYGEFVNGTFNGSAQSRDDNGQPWNPADEPWRQIFQRGGASEFPPEQVFAYHWHLKPPYREVTFPQLEGLEVHDLYCPECDRGIFSALSLQEVVDQLRTHLTAGIDRRHEYRPEDLKALGEREGINFFSRGLSPRSIRQSVPVSGDAPRKGVDKNG